MAVQVDRLTQSEAARTAQWQQNQAANHQALAELQALKETVAASAATVQASSAAAAVGLPPGLTGPPPSYAASSTPSRTSSTPYDQRTEAILFGLGNFTTEDALLAAAGAALRTAGIDPANFDGPTANRRNTVVFLNFKLQGGLKAASSKMRCANLTGSEGKRIWLDARRTREENKPAR